MSWKQIRLPLLLIILVFLFPTFILATSETNSEGDSESFSSENEMIVHEPVFQRGMSYAAWSSNAYNSLNSDESLALLAETNTEWISIVVTWYQNNSLSHNIHPDPERTPTNKSVAHAISQAHNLGLKVMLKPVVDILEGKEQDSWPTWRGDILPSDEWFESYINFITFFAEFAEQNEVELFCVGCEYKMTTQEKQQWKEVVSKVRQHYSGPIIYAADWTNYQNIEWWDSLDYVGIDAYFPLSLLKHDPTFEEIEDGLSIHVKEIEEWYLTVNKPIIFSEIGYRSGNGTNISPGNHWIDMSIDLQEQKDCYEVAFKTCWNMSWFYGFYWWNWEADPNAGGPNNTGYTPQNKPAQNVLKDKYSTNRFVTVIDKTFVSANRSGVNKNQLVGFHVSWEHNATALVDGRVYVNGTEYVTNATGWVTFSPSYEEIGKRLWLITDVKHPEIGYYKQIIDNPHIIWDKIKITNVDVNTNSLGKTEVKVNAVNEYDNSPTVGANTTVNGILCNEVQPGVYTCEVNNWSPYQILSIYINHLTEINEDISSIHIMNTALWTTLIIIGVLTAFLAIRYLKSSLIQNRSSTF